MNRTSKNILIVGGSRGIGAASARLFGRAGNNLVLTYHTRKARAVRVANELEVTANSIRIEQLNMANSESIERLAEKLKQLGNKLDVIVISAAGGMERGQPKDYAWQLNAVGPKALVLKLAPLCSPGCECIFVTSHEAHLFGEKVAYEGYSEIAESKKAGEQALLNEKCKLSRAGINFSIVSADIVEDSPTAKLLELRDRGLLEQRRKILGKLPKSEDVARAIYQVSEANNEFGHVTLVWEMIGYLDS